MTTYHKLMLLPALALACLGSARAADVNVTGRWKSEFDSPVGLQKYTFEFKADGEKLTGKAFGDRAGEKRESEIKEGKINKDEISFVEVLKIQDQDIRVEFKGKIAGDEIKFTRKVGDFGTQEIVAKREKESPAPPPAPPAKP